MIGEQAEPATVGGLRTMSKEEKENWNEERVRCPDLWLTWLNRETGQYIT